MMTKTSRHCSGRGFTLLEVMISLVIVAIALTAMAVTMGGMLNTATTMRERTYASWIAQNKIVEMRVANEVPEPGTESGDIDYANAVWDWSTEISETGVENLLRVDVTISRPDNGERIHTVTGFIGEPIVPGESNQVWGQLATGSGSNDRESEGSDYRQGVTE